MVRESVRVVNEEDSILARTVVAEEVVREEERVARLHCEGEDELVLIGTARREVDACAHVRSEEEGLVEELRRAAVRHVGPRRQDDVHGEVARDKIVDGGDDRARRAGGAPAARGSMNGVAGGRCVVQARGERELRLMDYKSPPRKMLHGSTISCLLAVSERYNWWRR